MSFDHYQQCAARTRKNRGDLGLLYAAIAIAGEAGELLDQVKKIYFHGYELKGSREPLILEAGDVLWGVAELCTVLGIPMSQVVSENIAKLQRRYPEGYSDEASRNRK